MFRGYENNTFLSLSRFVFISFLHYASTNYTNAFWVNISRMYCNGIIHVLLANQSHLQANGCVTFFNGPQHRCPFSLIDPWWSFIGRCFIRLLWETLNNNSWFYQNRNSFLHNADSSNIYWNAHLVHRNDQKNKQIFSLLNGEMVSVLWAHLFGTK